MISYYRRTKQDSKLKRLPEFRVGCWINVEDPSEEELEKLAGLLDLDTDLLNDGLDPDEIPRVEVEGDKVYVLVKTVDIKNKALDTLLVVVGGTFVLTLSRRPQNFLKEIRKTGKVITTQRTKLLISVLDKNDQELEEMTNTVVKQVQKRGPLKNIEFWELNNLLQSEVLLNNLVSFYYYTRLVYTRLLKTIRLYEEDRDIIESLLTESEERFNLSKNALRTLSNIRDYYMILSSSRLNRMINVLTVLTIIISIPAAISGVYGMNVALPLQHDQNVFLYIMAVIFGLWAVFLYYVKRSRLL